MKRHRRKPTSDKFAEEIWAKQQNIVWPGPLVNSRVVEEFFWKGSPSPTTTQRIAAWLFGTVHIGGASMLAVMGWHMDGNGLIVLGGMAILVFAFGIKTFSNGFAKRRKR
jgi:hypothetical protein